MSLTSVDLPEPDTPVTATNSPSGNDDVDVAQVVLPGAEDGQLAARRCAGGGSAGPGSRGGRRGTAR